MKIVEVWEFGFIGRGVIIGIVDNGVEINYFDLKVNVVCIMLFIYILIYI